MSVPDDVLRKDSLWRVEGGNKDANLETRRRIIPTNDIHLHFLTTIETNFYNK